MSSYLEKKREIDEAIENYSRTRNGKRLKTIALVSIIISVALLLIIAFEFDHISLTCRLIMQGAAGLGAIAFVITTGVLLYRSNCSVWSS